MTTLQDDNSLVTSQRAEYYSNSQAPNYNPPAAQNFSQNLISQEPGTIPIEQSQQTYFTKTYAPQNQYATQYITEQPQNEVQINNQVPSNTMGVQSLPPYLILSTPMNQETTIPVSYTPQPNYNQNQFIAPTQYEEPSIVNDFDQSENLKEKKYARLTTIFAILGIFMPPLFILSFLFSRKSNKKSIRVIGNIALLCFDILLLVFVFWIFTSY
ncbi:hypothetical protein EDI_154070 [Entamoeba dispar SAW760]|uniref:Uncharacterized protein n=1 Tax=Entamoeba dispar (strain ATCC PRA-260 / SAW760) TaxID=370354 RepID=B0E603_ENTDS|nr:uncharacterized protein EDI_154070 [Entamoeba dispar SAW760]EDR30040.1 hypothetical protein EDI_154070 [Entamoeba dispar SAW760]|eukprot:EDR30040.1 hypothetical protein EDI_154070 [Entamoeba dispar SAW760]